MSRLPLSCVLLVILAPAVLVLAAGCGGASGPKTFPVKGKVVFKGQGNMRFLIGSTIRCQSESDPDVMAVGYIEDDGVFSLGTVYKGKTLDGVPAGKYKVRIEPPLDDAEGKPVRGVILPKYEDYDKSGLSFTVPTTGDIELVVERPR